MYCLYIHLYTFRKSFEDRPLNKWLSLAGAGSGIHVFAAALFGFICRSGIQAPACVCLRRHCLGSTDVSSHSNCSNNSYSRDNFLRPCIAIV